MNRAQAKAKLVEISHSTATKHSKVLISELCGVIQFLLEELERVQTPKMNVLTTLPTSPYDLDRTRRDPGPRPWKSPPPFSPNNPSLPGQHPQTFCDLTKESGEKE